MKQAPVCGLFGRRGVGKTTLARKVARHQARIVVLDYMAEYGPLAFREEHGRLGGSKNTLSGPKTSDSSQPPASL